MPTFGSWTMNVGGSVYGPYTLERMRAFVGEGRLGPRSLIARDGAGLWREAATEPEFADLFPASGPISAAHPIAAAPTPEAQFAKPAASHDTGERSQFVIFVDMKLGSGHDLETLIGTLGHAFELQPNVWILSTHQTINGIRNLLLPEMGKRDSFFIIDAARGKAIWHNLGPETEARIRHVWQKAS